MPGLCASAFLPMYEKPDELEKALFPKSGRGFTTDNNIKPDIVAPAVNVFGPSAVGRNRSEGQFTTKTGTYGVFISIMI